MLNPASIRLTDKGFKAVRVVNDPLGAVGGILIQYPDPFYPGMDILLFFSQDSGSTRCGYGELAVSQDDLIHMGNDPAGFAVPDRQAAFMEIAVHEYHSPRRLKKNRTCVKKDALHDALQTATLDSGD
jgi:hypothetical protein